MTTAIKDSLTQELAGPLTDREREALNKATDYAMGDTWTRLIPLIDRVLLERTRLP